MSRKVKDIPISPLLDNHDEKMSPDEAIEVLRSLQDWLYFCSMNGGTKIEREAIDVAIACLEEKCHE